VVGRGRDGLVVLNVAWFQFLVGGAAVAWSLGVAADDWPQWLGPERDSVWRETGVMESFPAGGPKQVWRAEIGAGYSGPAISGDRVYVTDRVMPENTPKPKSAFDASQIPGAERVLCLDANDGGLIWKLEYNCPYTISYSAGPRATPIVRGGRVYALGAMGNLNCLDAKTGAVLWTNDFKESCRLKIPTWGVSANPLLDGDTLYCLAGGEGSVALALDAATGKERWRALSAAEPGYAPPRIFTLAGRRQLILWHAEAVNGLEPETGRLLWAIPWKMNYGMSIPTPRQNGDNVFFTAFYNGSLMLHFEAGKDAPSVVWRTQKMSERDTTHLNSVMATPFWEDGFIYGPCSYGQFRCVRADTGERIWETFAPTSGKSERWGNCFVVKNGGRFVLFSEKGDLIFAKLSQKGYEETSRAHLIEPANTDPGRPVVWTHPAYAHRRVYLRNDKEAACFDLAAP
jgi:outer membrane protein assembly factor BamB